MPVAEVRTAVRPVDPVEVKFIEGNFTRGSSGRLILARAHCAFDWCRRGEVNE
jgi:hypothetical protein